MKKISLLFGILTILISLKAQETNCSQSNVEKFLNDQDRSIIGFTLYSVKDPDNNNQYDSYNNISLMKYIEPLRKDTMLGLIFYGRNDRSGGKFTAWTYYKAIIDYEEVNNIISWLDFVRQQIIKDPSIDYFSFTPKRGNLLIYITKNKNLDFSLNIQYDKFDQNSFMTIFGIDKKKAGNDFVKLDDYCIKLKEIQKVIDKNKK